MQDKASIAGELLEEAGPPSIPACATAGIPSDSQFSGQRMYQVR